ncbi:MAG: ABC transporter ATP-binding protein [Candidatus Eremiobacteraeota bacterium]|nr:ABC transporter ATP-binding protein [Candidatus Eremiobacteraeota bacterium]
MSQPALIEARDLYRFYHIGDDETLALRGVSLSVLAGEMVAIMGPSGSGKSTLLACLGGLDEPDGGYVLIGGQRITRRPEAQRAEIRARRVGILMQTGNLLGHLSVADNVRLQQLLAKNRTSQAIPALLASVGLSDRAHSYPDQLSGGEAARAGLAVALAHAPQVLLADEPTGEVDAVTEESILTILRAWANDGRAVVLGTHSDAAAKRADRRVHLRDGRVVSEATP